MVAFRLGRARVAAVIGIKGSAEGQSLLWSFKPPRRWGPRCGLGERQVLRAARACMVGKLYKWVMGIDVLALQGVHGSQSELRAELAGVQREYDLHMRTARLNSPFVC